MFLSCSQCKYPPKPIRSSRVTGHGQIVPAHRSRAGPSWPISASSVLYMAGVPGCNVPHYHCRRRLDPHSTRYSLEPLYIFRRPYASVHHPVFALYRDARNIRVIVILFFAIEIIGMGAGMGLSYPGIQFADDCVVVWLPFTILVYGCVLNQRYFQNTHGLQSFINRFSNALVLADTLQVCRRGS